MTAPPPHRPPLILASTSRYRRELLQRLRLPFEVEAPQVDEAPQPGEAPAALSVRLAEQKAQAVALRHPGALVIGSDQVAELDGAAIGKPGTHARAVEQLRWMSGREVVFHTAVAVVRHAVAAASQGGDRGAAVDAAFAQSARVPVQVRFRVLSDDEIAYYLHAEQPYDCAGSAKAEALGIALIEHLRSDDPTALIGLPLIRTCALLRAAGLDPLRP